MYIMTESRRCNLRSMIHLTDWDLQMATLPGASSELVRLEDAPTHEVASELSLKKGPTPESDTVWIISVRCSLPNRRIPTRLRAPVRQAARPHCFINLSRYGRLAAPIRFQVSLNLATSLSDLRDRQTAMTGDTRPR